MPPQPSETVPLHWFSGHGLGFGTQVQTLFEQVFGLWQVPQLSVPPHPSEMLPQFLPCAAQVVGVQVQTLLVQA